MTSETSPPLHPDLEPLAALAGTWSGRGTGVYPTIEPFAYEETLIIGHGGKPFLTWSQRTVATDTGIPLHVETGYLRCRPGADGSVVELVVAHPTGHAEVAEGVLERHDLEVEQTTGIETDGDVQTSAMTLERVASLAVELRSTSVQATASAKPVESLERRLRLQGDTLTYSLLMGAVGLAHQVHLRAELHRVDG
jgi:hypothetical protein